MEKIDQILDSLYDRVIEPIEAKKQLLDLFAVMQRSELFKKRCSFCGVDELFTKDDYCNCCGAKQVSFFK